MPARTASLADAIVLGLVAAFQVALVLGAPWGEYAQGGAVREALSGAGHVVALRWALRLVAMALGVPARGGPGHCAVHPSDLSPSSCGSPPATAVSACFSMRSRRRPRSGSTGRPSRC